MSKKINSILIIAICITMVISTCSTLSLDMHSEKSYFVIRPVYINNCKIIPYNKSSLKQVNKKQNIAWLSTYSNYSVYEENTTYSHNGEIYKAPENFGCLQYNKIFDTTTKCNSSITYHLLI